ncbi:hypothetical protein DFJ73DRAFT_781540 [Zopfochytrium polystomum]|nr:hypothetical protein DFJ73DRAFT_781540 [Zopfochytrium polystomum]
MSAFGEFTFCNCSTPHHHNHPSHRNDRIDILVLGDRRSGRTHLSTRFVYGVFAGRRGWRWSGPGDVWRVDCVS